MRRAKKKRHKNGQPPKLTPEQIDAFIKWAYYQPSDFFPFRFEYEAAPPLPEDVHTEGLEPS